MGHKRITLISGPEKVSTSIDRVRGYQRAMKEYGLSEYIEYIYGNYSVQCGIDLTNQIFSRKRTPTAVFGGNNFISNGVITALNQQNLLVPEDVSVVSFDDIPQKLSPNPFLTVIVQPPYEIGQKATEILLERIQEEGIPTAPYQDIVFPVELIVRESSGENREDRPNELG
jgi:DNA-binding LacI/PurR family transcriptional regulator